MKTKRCTKCGEVRPYEMFNKTKAAADGHVFKCKICYKDYHKTYYKDNRDKKLDAARSYYKINKKKINAYQKTYRETNKERLKKKNRDYIQANKNRHNERCSRGRALKRKAIPKFLRKCEIEKVRLRDIYKLREVISLATGIEHHVDHMWPLSDGGPHWSGNLQIITAKENLTKRDKVYKVTKKNIKDSLRIARKEYENSSNGH